MIYWWYYGGLHFRVAVYTDNKKHSVNMSDMTGISEQQVQQHTWRETTVTAEPERRGGFIAKRFSTKNSRQFSGESARGRWGAPFLYAYKNDSRRSPTSNCPRTRGNDRENAMETESALTVYSHTGWSKKTDILCFVRLNLIKYWPTFKLISLSESTEHL